jgi:uncharacterized membrane protein YeaQ/YmgE (transglycosylase-associated protein family)
LRRQRALTHLPPTDLVDRLIGRETEMFGDSSNWLVTIILGLLAGALAKLLMPGRDPGGCIITILLGIAGALLGTWLGRLLHLYGPNDRAGFIGAVVGAFIILLIYRLVAGRRRY